MSPVTDMDVISSGWSLQVKDDKFSLTVDVNGETKEFTWTDFHNGTSFFLSDGETAVKYEMGAGN